ncbi:NUDIX hydrolase [Serpentinicella sp. ANB-PHB4]|uniref:NUDIX hydrolase n=1 Tax=Serpentinicella sp. ANB-PHB4 TaxID=3074076 RepID=UPI0028588FD0|nr:NUDIX hydrolase [Serpentinicella sp. ANB-PHB4]MDR5658172.1 NUDIX hydrolase [Serpentinicella sp. ANB-PHB4]
MEKTIKTEKIYDGKIINLKVETVELADKKYSKREVVEHKGAAGVLPITYDGNIILVKQYRKPIERSILEIPAGRIELKEDPQSAALRELKEETGYTSSNVKKMLSFYSSPGFTNEEIHIYLALNLESGLASPDDGENLEIVKMDINHALSAILNGEIKDSKTVMSILYYSRMIEEVK